MLLEADPDTVGITETVEKEEEVSEEKQNIRCGLCGATITDYREKIALNGVGEKAYTNPHGYIFEIACFRNAPGCLRIGFPTEEYTWFPGYVWRYAVCGSCKGHLGWHFANGIGDTFYGLIVKRLIFPA